MSLKSPKDIVTSMMATDRLSQWLGIEVIDVQPNYCKVKMKVTDEMVNGFQIAHGGITYSLGDSCVAFAANTNGNVAVSIESSVSHLSKVMVGDVLIAFSECIHKNDKMGNYFVTILNQNNDKVAHFKGLMYFTQKHH